MTHLHDLLPSTRCTNAAAQQIIRTTGTRQVKSYCINLALFGRKFFTICLPTRSLYRDENEPPSKIPRDTAKNIQGGGRRRGQGVNAGRVEKPGAAQPEWDPSEMHNVQ